ncbi:hypothetical protein [Bdellovibrio bacteriovorus]|uniref:hypothetical protein n=1 Tax=Bdellovibrio bacteriovorus TaxID=959 RepID=UPI00045BFFA2|nr:hypothetical protein [Bdellovibrio bacteriovorus]AHZ86649.1 hypothetical protein EP01_17160 [Bdellovibrio bacteriovorus]BEV67090.1 hypothetical protein Bb109J_c0510 [Bdellovibrio bacteriovorus]
MRWSKSILTLGLIAGCVNLAACKKQSNNPVRTAKISKASAPLTEKQKAERAAMTSAQLCYQDLCASQSTEISYETLMTKAAQPSKDQKDYYQQHLEARLKEAIDAKVQLHTTTLNQLQAKESEFANAELNEAQMRLIKVIYILNGKEISESDQKAIFAKISTYDFAKAEARAKLQGPQAYLLSMHPDKTVMDAARAEISHILELQEALNTAIGFKFIDMEHGAIARLKAGGAADASELKDLIQSSYSVRLVHILTLKDTAIADALPLKSETIRTHLAKSDLKARLQKRLAEAPSLKSACEVRIYQGLNLYPEVKDVTAFQEKVEVVREQVLKNLNSQDPAFEIVKKIAVYMPESINDLSKSLVQSLNDRARTDRLQVEKLLKMDASTTLLLGSLLSQTLGENDLLCEDLVNLNISDFASPGLTGIKVSWMSVKLPTYGISILAHEFAHHVFAHAKQFESAKACLADKQGSQQFLNEDFSDVLAAKVVLQLQNVLPKKQSNYGCFFASEEKDPSLKVDGAQAVHSSGLYRALQIAQVRKELIPDTCKKLVTAQNSKALNSCEM